MSTLQESEHTPRLFRDERPARVGNSFNPLSLVPHAKLWQVLVCAQVGVVILAALYLGPSSDWARDIGVPRPERAASDNVGSSWSSGGGDMQPPDNATRAEEGTSSSAEKAPGMEPPMPQSQSESMSSGSGGSTICGMRRLDKGTSAEAEVVIIVVGGIRDGHLTLPSFVKWVLSTPPQQTGPEAGAGPASASASASASAQAWFQETPESPRVLDLFVKARLDESSFRVLGLFPGCLCGDTAPCAAMEAARFPLGHVTISMAPDTRVDSKVYDPPMYRSFALEQFQDYQDVVALMERHEQERRQGRLYKWLLKMRADSFWWAPPPPIARLAVPEGHELAFWTWPRPDLVVRKENYSLSHDSRIQGREFLYIPWGHDCFGYNDRGALGPRVAMKAAFMLLDELSHLKSDPPPKKKGDDNWHVVVTPVADWSVTFPLPAEGIFRLSAEYDHHLLVMREIFPFCVLTRHPYYARALNKPHPKVGGAYCRPCNNHSVNISEWCSAPDDVCAAASWDQNWEEIFDASVTLDLAEQRRRMSSLTLEACNSSLINAQLLFTSTDAASDGQHSWLAPSPIDLCSKGNLPSEN